MRALYYIALATGQSEQDTQLYEENVKANENCLNQNFMILTQKVSELEARLAMIEGRA